MQLTESIKKCLDKSVLCWLASCSTDLVPNVSPKEIFTHIDDQFILVANIASPNTIKNIKANPNICISAIDILVQKGYKLKGSAEVIDKQHPNYEKYKAPLYEMAGDKFPFSNLIKMKLQSAHEILAPSYTFYPSTTTEEGQIENAKRIYGLSE